MNNSNSLIRPDTVNLISRILNPIADTGVITVPELNTIIAHLKHLAEHGTPQPPIPPKLIDRQAAADMLSLSLSNFKKLESENAFPFKRRMIGSAVRYRNTDIIAYILSADIESIGAEIINDKSEAKLTV